jgi:polysaccharide biosynthesis/export protein
MHSGTSDRGRRSCAAVYALVAWLCCYSAAAQEKPKDATPAQAVPVVTPGEPASQVAVGSPGQATGAQPARDNPKSDNPDASAASGLTRIGPGDLISVTVYNVPELNSKARVGNSGDVYLPLIDYVHLADLTVEEAQALLEKRLADGGFVRNPHVTIFVDESQSQGVSVVGEVGKPGIYPNAGDRKLYDVLSLAGGFTPTASRKISIIRRNNPQPINLDLPRNLADDLSGNVDIEPGDTITVPRAPIIYVVGDVARPSGLLVDNGSLTVLQAIALAGGTNKTAKLGSVRILRKGPTGMTETEVRLKKMLEAKSPDVTLQANDILFVPVSGGRVLAARTFEAAMSAATAVTIYTVRP